MRLFAVSGQVTYEKDGWKGSRQIPSFLVSNVHVETEDQAKAWADRIVRSGWIFDGEKCDTHICAVELGEYVPKES